MDGLVLVIKAIAFGVMFCDSDFFDLAKTRVKASGQLGAMMSQPQHSYTPNIILYYNGCSFMSIQKALAHHSERSNVVRLIKSLECSQVQY